MTNNQRLAILSVLGLVGLSVCISSRSAKVTAQNSSHDPTWWSKYEFIRDNGGDTTPLSTSSSTVNGIDVGSDPTLAFDTQGNVFYGYIVVFFSNGNGINGTEMAVARSTDGGKTYPAVTFFSFENGTNHFNDKPMITADTNQGSALR